MRMNFSKKLLTILFWITVLGISFYFYYNDVLKYFIGKLEPRQESEKLWLVVHFTGAACILILGPLQFWAYFRNHFWKWHRIAGKFYIAGSIVSAMMVFYLLSNYPLPGSIPSLGLLAVIWLFKTIAAFWFATKRNFKLHKQFMIRSYVCGFAFVFIRLLPIINNYAGIFNFMKDEEMRSTVYEWICWVYPLMITEFILIWLPSISKLKTSKSIKLATDKSIAYSKADE
jgi:uncharacterized membrane protein